MLGLGSLQILKITKIKLPYTKVRKLIATKLKVNQSMLTLLS